MRRWQSAWLAAAALLALAQGARADERILSFDSAITVESNGSLYVRETIRVRSEGKTIRRGIVREFPTIYGDGTRQVVVGFSFQAASRDGQPEPWRTEHQGNGVRIYLGSAQTLLPTGEHTYEVVYRTDRQMGFFADHDELYWNVTGNGTNFVIDRATARVILPDNVPRDALRLEAYTGPQGAKDQNFTARLDAGVPLFETTRALQPREGLTIVVMWPKGFISVPVEGAVPQNIGPQMSPGYDMARDAGQGSSGPRFDSPLESFLKRELPHDGRPVFFALFGLALLIGYYYFIWDRVGRDPPGKVIIPRYDTPEGQSPASMRYLVRMGYDDQCFAAAVLSLAVKGHLRIQQDTRILGIGKLFTLIKETSRGAKPLSRDESALLAKLFSRGDSLVLEQKNHSVVRASRRAHERSLDQDYSRGFFSINGGWHFLGIAISIVVAASALLQPGATTPWPRWFLTTVPGWITLVASLAALISNGIFGWLLKAPTVRGRDALDHIEGFKQYLEVAEGQSLQRIDKPPPKMTPAIYEAYLPAALALGVEQTWAEKFASALRVNPEQYQPGWYAGPSWNPARAAAFSSQLGSSLSSAISSSSQAPGSSSGGGGRGSSGGGGGGGGVGGW